MIIETNGFFVVGTHQIKKGFFCFKCAEYFYNELKGKKYLINTKTNKIIHNTYGWKNEME